MSVIQSYIVNRISSHATAPRDLAADIARLYRWNRIVRGLGAQSAMQRALEYVWTPTGRPALYWGARGQWGAISADDRDGLRYVDSWADAGLRFVGWADDILPLRHTGWLTNDNDDALRGAVWQLPGRKGRARLVSGYCEMEGRGETNPGSAIVACRMIEDVAGDSLTGDDGARDAARYADGIAEREAEAQRDYQESYAAGREAAESDNLAAETRRELLPLLAEFRQVRRGRLMLSELLCDLLQRRIREGLAEYRGERAKRDSAWGDCPSSEESAWRDGFMDSVDGNGFVRAVRLGYAKASDWRGPPDANPCARLRVVTAIGYSHWASYLINGDASGIEDDEIAAADSFAEYLGGPPVSCGDESFFGRPDAPHGALYGDCLEYSALIRESVA